MVENETKENERKEMERKQLEKVKNGTYNGTGKTNGSVTENDELAKAMETLNTSMLMGSTNGKPKVYEPTAREKDLLENLELSSIMIQSDPDDSNRYFKRTDPGDWYRVIMKGKESKDGKTKAKKAKKGSRKHSSQTDTSDTTEESGKRRRRKSKGDSHDEHNEPTHKRKHRKSKSASSSDTERTKSKSVDLSKAYEALLQSGNLNETSLSMTTGSKTLPAHHNESALRDSGRFKAADSNVSVSKPVVVNSKPPESGQPKSRVIMSQPTAVKPSGPVKHVNTVQQIAQQVKNPTPSVISSTPAKEADNTTLVQSSPARPRSNLFSGRSGSFNASTDKASKETPVKRPDSVPPLNLTDDLLDIEDDEASC